MLAAQMPDDPIGRARAMAAKLREREAVVSATIAQRHEDEALRARAQATAMARRRQRQEEGRAIMLHEMGDRDGAAEAEALARMAAGLVDCTATSAAPAAAPPLSRH